MDLPTALSKFIIQEIDDLFYLYSENDEAKKVIKENLIYIHNQRLTFKEIHNEIILNKLSYNFLINKTK